MSGLVKTRVALVVGGSGVTVTRSRRTSCLARRPIEGFESSAVDLADAEAATVALRRAADTTHFSYVVLKPDADLAIEAARSAGMLGDLLDGLGVSLRAW